MKSIICLNVNLGHRVVNDTLETISVDLGFHGDTMAEGMCQNGLYLYPPYVHIVF